MKSASRIALTMLAMLSVGAALPIGEASSQELNSIAKAGLAKTWLSLAAYVARPVGCVNSPESLNPRGVFSFTSSNGRTVARFIELSPTVATEEGGAELLAYLTADIVRANGAIDPAFGSRLRDMIIATTNDGRITVRFVDFSSGEFSGGL